MISQGVVAGALGLVVSALASQAAAQDPRPITIDEYITTPIVADPQLSPDGSVVAFTVSTPSLEENRSHSHIWFADVADGDTWQATVSQANERAPRWSPDGKVLAFISTRDGGPQLWRMPARGGEATRITESPHGIADFIWSPDGKALYFWTDVPWGDSSEAARRAAPWPTTATIVTDLFYRHWNEWRVGVRSHVFRATLDGELTDITPIDRDVPSLALGGADVAVSTVGTELAIVFNNDSALATSTNNDVFVMGPDGSARQPVTISPGNDHTPRYSPDGRFLAYLAMATAGFEADRQQLMLYERASGRRLQVTPRWDLSITDYRWLPDARAVVAEVEERGAHAIYRIEVPSGRATRLVGSGNNTALQLSADGETLVFLRSTGRRPPEIWTAAADGRNQRAVTTVNAERFRQFDIASLERFGFIGARGDSVFGWMMKPPGALPGVRYPLIYLIHGGPQGAWLDQWHSRWNYALFAARGYAVAAVNFHGSTGYGQDFTNSISRNWGGLPYEDLMKGLDALARQPWVDTTRMAAAGASYGGYMVYWMAGQTKRFKVLVAHDGIFNPLSMAGTTEELWFPHWEFGGLPFEPAARATMEKWSPANFAQKWTTPMLIIHGQLDYRVDVSEGLQAFTALRLRGVPGKLLYFPDEDHFVTQPRNRRLWWGTVLDWIDQYLQPAP